VRRPTVFLNNGEDGQNVEQYALGGRDALDRGYNALLFYGPGRGRGRTLFQRQVPFRFDCENVVTPVGDYLRSRPEVDPDRIVLAGSSLGGKLVIGAAAFEHRLAAVVSDPGMLRLWTVWETNFPSLVPLFAQRREQEGDQ
jgi:dienelactone hydrolase